MKLFFSSFGQDFGLRYLAEFDEVKNININVSPGFEFEIVWVNIPLLQKSKILETSNDVKYYPWTRWGAQKSHTLRVLKSYSYNKYLFMIKFVINFLIYLSNYGVF